MRLLWTQMWCNQPSQSVTEGWLEIDKHYSLELCKATDIATSVTAEFP